MKKLITITFCALITLSLVACGNSDKKETEKTNQTSVQIPNPIVEYSSFEEARKAVDFDFKVLCDLPDEYTIDSVSVINGNIVQIIYKNGTDEICYRVSTEIEDISGNYNEYPTNKKVIIDDCEVTLKGNDDIINLATWKKDDFNFSLSLNSTTNTIDSNTVELMIKSVL